MVVDYREIEQLLAGREVPKADLLLAGSLYERGAVQLVDVPDDLFSDALLVYHLNLNLAGRDARKLQQSSCALFSNSMRLHNGVILKDGHPGLCCTGHSCGHSICPVALAACFKACAEGGLQANQIPLYSKYLEHWQSQSMASQFLDKWGDSLHNSQVALNLLTSKQENDFSGSVVIKDYSAVDEFVSNVYDLLVSMGKIEEYPNDEGKYSRRIILSPLLQLHLNTIQKKRPEGTLTTFDLPISNCLLVLTRPESFVEYVKSNDYHILEKFYIDTLLEQLGTITDDCYVLVVGEESAITSLCTLNECLESSIGQHRMYLPSMPADEVYEYYVQYLNPEVRAQIEDPSAFKREFVKYVSFNRDSIPYTGSRLADFLAKHANASNRPVLPASRYQSSSIDEMMESVVGLQKVKDTMRDLKDYVTLKSLARAEGKRMRDMSLHMVFSGNPGTGKTMMGQMISLMLYKIGIIKENKYTEVTSKDLVSGYVGQTAQKTNAVIQEALGGVLFIDEAYGLITGNHGQSSFGNQAIDELVKAMDKYKDRLVVILAGYEKEMNELLDSNPGLTSRIGYTFRFEDYSIPELVQIFQKAMEDQGFSCDQEVLDIDLPNLFDYYHRFQNFGNGRFAIDVLNRMVVKHSKAYGEGEVPEDRLYRLSAQDVPTRQELADITDWSPRPANELLEPLVGIDDLKERVCKLETEVAFREKARRHGMDLPDANMHMLFTGNPGTGKTTLARIIGKILYNTGALPTNKFIEVEARDLARHNTRTSQNDTSRIIKDSMGGVLFIDEAYAILGQPGADDIIATIVKAMEDHKGEFVVMFAGYANEMRVFVDRNPGLASRIGFQFAFEDYDTDELQEIFNRKATKAGFIVSDDAKVATRAVLKYFHNVESFGNGRFVDKLLQEVISKHAETATDETLRLLGASDIPTSKEMYKTVAAQVYEPSDTVDEDAIKKIAIHEMGHAICLLALENRTNIILVTVEEEGFGAAGYVQHKPDRGISDAQSLRNTITTNVAGLAAEKLIIGMCSTGGGSDLEKATRNALSYVGYYGLSNAGLVQYVGEYGIDFRHGGIQDLPSDLQQEIRTLLDDEFKHAQQLITRYRTVFDKMVDVLCDERTISGERITEIWKELTEGNDDGQS